ncbi:MAG TPA: serine/threonine-protein kinase [Myxococcaceae bacterium]|nr:serine/threonine-protein kinase [Myxococcaceae bacterium]
MSLVGRHIGRYRILEELGQGGMSVVYKGLDTALDREVAVKVLHAHLAGKEESRRRLAREAKAVARLHHPNILEIFDFAAPDAEQAYIVTEYIRGHTLRHYAESAGFEPPEIAAMVIHDVAAALAEAHEVGIIHRDLKPENVMVREDGVIKLMDFGIAKILDRDDRMTMTGALVGSPAHMAPEIIEGEEAGPEADVFSLGTMLFYFATGQLPFSASNTTATLKKILDGAYEDPRQLAPAISDELAEIIATCLSRQPSSRYSNARVLEEALRGYLDSLGLDGTAEELAAFFTDPATYRKALVPRLCDALVTRAEALVGDQRHARAVASINQVLALDPGNARALALLQRMNAARARQRMVAAWKKAALGGAVAMSVIGAALWAGAGRQIGTSVPTPPAAVAAPSLPAPAPIPERADVVPADARAARPVDRALPKAPPSDARPTIPARLAVVVKLRPYGYLEVDGQRKTAELTQHTLELAPGRHRVRYGCTYCETLTETIDVGAETRREFHWPVQALPSTIGFDFQPRDATVRVRGQERSVAESLDRPFEIRSPRGATDLRHRVEYEVAAPGYRTHRATVTVAPGESQILQGALTPQ